MAKEKECGICGARSDGTELVGDWRGYFAGDILYMVCPKCHAEKREELRKQFLAEGGRE